MFRLELVWCNQDQDLAVKSCELHVAVDGISHEFPHCVPASLQGGASMMQVLVVPLNNAWVLTPRFFAFLGKTNKCLPHNNLP